MSEYAAMLIDNNDRETLNFYIEETIRRFPGLNREQAEGIVRGRSTAITAEGAGYNTFTLTGLENLIRSLAGLPGRKVLFLLSSGFLIQNQRSDSIGRIQRVTGLAAKSGVVIYSIDVRGLVYEPGDIADAKPFDPTGRLRRATHGELRATQDGLNALARDTGGKPVFNTNDLLSGVRRGLNETSSYYLLAWKPDSIDQSLAAFAILKLPSSVDQILRCGCLAAFLMLSHLLHRLLNKRNCCGPTKPYQ